MKTIFQNLTCRKNFISKRNALYFFPIQNLTRCETFKSKSEVFYYFHSKIWLVVKCLIQNLLFKLSFQILAELFSNCYQLPYCWIMTMACEKKDFLRVCGFCLSHVWYYLFEYCVLFGTWAHGGCDDHIICTNNWSIQISLEFRKWLVYKDFILF